MARIKMFLKELFIKNYRGIDKKRLVFKENINILYGANRSGKTSIVDSLLFLQRYLMNPSHTLEHLLNIWFGEAIAHGRSREFSIFVKTIDREEGLEGFFGLRVDVDKNRVREIYIVEDTVFSIENGVLEASDLKNFKEKSLGLVPRDESIWDVIGKKKITIARLPWRTVAGLISSEIIYYGFETAYTKTPDILSKILVSRLTDFSEEAKKLFGERLVMFLRYAFKTLYHVKRSVIVKYIDYKNAVGPSKFRGHIIDPHFSNLPWIIYTMYERDMTKELIDCLRGVGIPLSMFGVEKTVDQRYYIVLETSGREIMRDGIPASMVKLLSLCTASCYSRGFIVFDDYDEYIDPSIVGQLLGILRDTGKQYIFTTRRKPLYVDDAGFINIIPI